MPTAQFSDLNHTQQLEILERHTRQTLASAYGFDHGAMSLRILQYEDNAVWRVDSPGHPPAVARLSIRDGRTTSQQRDEMRWLESLANSGTVRVPEPIMTSAREYVVSVDIAGHPEPSTLALLQWVPGHAEPPYREPGIAEAMGRATAHLHANSTAIDIPNFERPEWNAHTIIETGHALTTTEGRRQMGDGLRALQEAADLITPILGRTSLTDIGRIHGDLHRENMIALPGNGVGVIDFDDCGTGAYLLDIATALSSIHRIAATIPDAYPTFASEFLTGYRAVRALPTRFDEQLEAYLVLRDIQVLNFVTAAITINQAVASWGPRRITGIVESLGNYRSGGSYPGARW